MGSNEFLKPDSDATLAQGLSYLMQVLPRKTNGDRTYGSTIDLAKAVSEGRIYDPNYRRVQEIAIDFGKLVGLQLVRPTDSQQVVFDNQSLTKQA